MQNRTVSDGDARPDDAGELLVDMDDYQVLDIAVLTDDNWGKVSAKYGPVPDTCFRFERDVPEQHGRGSDERRRIDTIDRLRDMT